MAEKAYDPEDPFHLIGIELPGQTEAELRDMALCFAEEFARDGWTEEQLLKIFQSPFYQGPHMVWKQKGEEFVRSVIQEAINMWCPLRRKQ